MEGENYAVCRTVRKKAAIKMDWDSNKANYLESVLYEKGFFSFLIAFLSFLSFLRLRTNDIPCLNKSTTMEKRKTTSSKVQTKLTSFYRVLKDFFLPFVNVSFSQQQPRYQST